MPVNYDLSGAAPDSEEQRMIAAINDAGKKAGGNLGKIALGVAASFLLYRKVSKRALKEAVELEYPTTADAFGELAIRVTGAYMDVWIPTLAVNLALGYRAGLAEVGANESAWAMSAAETYAASLGSQVNARSIEALVTSVNAQVNRGVPLRLAIDRTINAFGVTPATANALVNLWTSAPQKMLTSAPKKSGIAAAVDRKIAEAITRRARTIGETEAYLTRNAAKAMYWAWQEEQGKIPGAAEKEWITADDERTCPVCAPLHRVRVLVSEKFPSSVGPLMAPGVHPNCRCELKLHRNMDLSDLMSAPRETVGKSAWGVIHKARGDDEYDRDKNGRFSATESRGAAAVAPRERFKEYEPTMRPPQMRPALSGPNMSRAVSQPQMRRVESTMSKPTSSMRELTAPDIRKTMATVFQGKMTELEMDKAAESIATRQKKAVKTQAKAMKEVARQVETETVGQTLLSVNLSSGAAMSFSAKGYSADAVANEMEVNGHKDFMAAIAGQVDAIWHDLPIHTEARDSEDSVEWREIETDDGEAVLINYQTLIDMAQDVRDAKPDNEHFLDVVSTGRGYARNTPGTEDRFTSQDLYAILNNHGMVDDLTEEAVKHRHYSFVVDDKDVQGYVNDRGFIRDLIDGNGMRERMNDMVENPFDDSWRKEPAETW